MDGEAAAGAITPAGMPARAADIHADRATRAAADTHADRATRAAANTHADRATRAAANTHADRATRAAANTHADRATRAAADAGADRATRTAANTPADRATRATLGNRAAKPVGPAWARGGAEGVAVTTDGGRLPFDRLVVAVGARPVEAVPGATVFRGPVSAGAVEYALNCERVVLTAPDEAWTLPLYELALLSGHPNLTIVTPERRPLDLFGEVVSEAVERRIGTFIGETVPDRVIDGALVTRAGDLIPADAVIALPRLRGPHIAGLPSVDGFIPIDAHARVTTYVFAAGDATNRRVKQGGLATQQADAAAQAIAAEAGAPVTPRPFTRILRAHLLTPDGSLELCRDLDAPAHKLAGRHLSAFLAIKEHV